MDSKKIKIRRASLEDIPEIMRMADVIFRKTYAEILSPEQMEYMMDWMYSAENLKPQVSADGKWFYIAEDEGTPAGYVSFELEDKLDDERNLYHLQKLYAMPDYQHTGLGRRMLEFAEREIAVMNPEGCRMELNVNRGNPAVDFYEHMGLTRARQGDFPIGKGFYMNDYIYALDFSDETYRKAVKDVAYEELYKSAKSLLKGESNLVSKMANLAAVLHPGMGFWWTGFYLVENGELILGPFQGPVACMHIPFGKGVCGTAWKEDRTVVVPDVELFPGHIACSSESRSEIVVPVRKDGTITAVLDIDSRELGTFDATDAAWLGKFVELI